MEKLLNSLFYIFAPAKTFSRTVVLTGTLVALPREVCRRVTLQNNNNDLIFTSHKGGEFEAVNASIFDIESDNTNHIMVKGTGDLCYLVHL